VYDLLQCEVLSVGGSAGINVAAAIRLGRQMGPDHVIVTILCDGGARYQSRLFNPDFLRGRGLTPPSWMS
jgi:cysteine synthase